MPWSTLLMTGLPDSLTPSNSDPQEWAHVCELVLGFGHFAASNIAQRWAYAIRYIFQKRLHRLMTSFDESESDPATLRWLEGRRRLDPASIAETEARLHTMHIYTDDVFGAGVGVQRTVLMIRTWVRTVREMRTIMAIPAKT